MKNEIMEILKAPYSRILIPDEDGESFSAEILEFPGCIAQGNNPTEAFVNLEKAAKAWIQASLDNGLEIPSPAMNQGYSGKIALRIPRSLHRRAAQFAERDATSLNQFLITAIASRIGAEEYHTRLCNSFNNNFLTCIAANTISLKSTLQNFVVINTLSNLYIKGGAARMDTQGFITHQSSVSDLDHKNIGPVNYQNASIALIVQET